MIQPSWDEVVGQVRDFVTREVAAGFVDPDGIAEAAVETFEEEADADLLEPVARRLVAEAVADHRAAEATWPDVTDCDRLDEALAELTRAGIVCRQNFSCCGNCGRVEIGAEIEDEESAGLVARGYAFYHHQDTEAAVGGSGVHLNYGAVGPGEAAGLGVAAEIVAALGRHGLAARWDGRLATRIQVELDWKRRLAGP